jgi:nucleoid-associated protein YgaU
MVKKVIVGGVVSCLAMFLLTGCPGIPVPTEEMEKAKAAIQAAEEAQAAKYAAEKLEAAKTDYAEAEKRIEAKKNEEAKELAISAYDKAVEAKNLSLARLEELKKNAESAIADAKEAINSAKEAEAEKYAPLKLKEAEDLLTQAEEALGKAEYHSAIDLANQSAAAAREAKRIALAKKEEELKKLEKPTHHIVVKGECFWIIAGYEEIYGNPFMWPKLYRANKHILRQPDNPHLIHPEQKFVIPRD